MPDDATYRPQPVDTSRVALPPSLEALVELLAENAHEVWAQKRLEEGWIHGNRRDDGQKTTPCLMSYAELPEQEKEYDRRLASETLRVMLALNYSITAPGDTAAAGPVLLTVDETLRIIRDDGSTVETLGQLWNSRSQPTWALHAELFAELASRMLGKGHPLLAYDVALQGLKYYAEEVALLLAMAIVRSRLGEHREARRLARRILQRQPDNAEAIGQLASAHKAAWRGPGHAKRRQLHLQQAIKFYVQAFDISQHYWPAINAATLLAIQGDAPQATMWARRTLQLCEAQAETTADGGDDFWRRATIAEAHAVLGDWPKALEVYAEAAQSPAGEVGRLMTARRQAMLLANHTGGPVDNIASALPAPQIVLFSGHMIDAADRLEPRFPESLVPEVRRKLAERLATGGPVIAIASAACGADLLFLDVLAEEFAGRAQAYVVLPFGREEFRQVSVEQGGEWWLQKFDQVCQRAEQADRLQVLSPQQIGGGETSLEYAMQVMLGMALQMADQFDTTAAPLAVWDGQIGARGGTGTNVELWREHGLKVNVIELPNSSSQSTDSAAEGAKRSEPIMAMMFADVKGFSKLTERQVSIFAEEYMGLAAETLKECGIELAHLNTWGDAIYFVSASIRDAGVATLEFATRLHRTDWTLRGLPAELGLRCALHAGPVVPIRDPLTGATNYVGAHVSRAARMEPITPVGQVYASQAFAALSRLNGVEEYTCQYMGLAPMAKGYGVLPAYRVLRATSRAE